VSISRRTWLLGAAGAAALGAGALSIPGGGPSAFFAGTPARTDIAPYGTRFSPSELRGELSWLVQTLREVGVKPFAYCDEAAFDAAYAAASAALNAPMDAVGFYRIAGPLFASLNDGHAGVSIAATFDEYRTRGGLAFPLLLEFREDGAYVAEPTDPSFPRGSKILGVDGIPADMLASSIVRFVGGQCAALRYGFAGSRLREVLWVLQGERRGYSVRALLPNGNTETRMVRAVGRDVLDLAAKRRSRTNSAAYTFARLAGGRVGYLDYRRCEDLVAFGQFLRATFGSIAAHSIDGLVIDIRRNGGGASSLNDELWQYVTNKPFTQAGDMTMRVSDRLKREYGFLKYNRLYPLAWLRPNGSALTLRGGSPAMTRPGRNDLRYLGQTYLLIGTRTFSSALLCAVAARDFGLATIVGQETGEPVNSTGEVYSGRSPRVGLEFGFTTKFFTGPKPRPDMQGVVPDVTIVPTEDDMRAGRDPVLAYATSRIVGNQASGPPRELGR
jgi:Peptidase family S41